MPAKLKTTLENIDKKVNNEENNKTIHDFYRYLKSIDTSENYQNGLLKVMIRFAEYLGPVTFSKIQCKEEIIQFLDLKRKDEDEDQGGIVKQ